MNIYEKLVEVQKAASYLQKENQGFNMKYVSSSQTLAAVRTTMDTQGLLCTVEITGHTIAEKATKTEGTQILTELDMLFTWVNAEKPEEKIQCPFYAIGLDSGEKGVGKALTYGEKFFFLKFFHIATDKDDPDAFEAKHESAEKKEEKADARRKSNKEKLNASGTTPPGPPLPDAAGPDPYSDEEHDMRREIGRMILDITGGDVEAAGQFLKLNTERIIDGKKFPGTTSTRNIFGPMLADTHARIAELHREWSTKQ